MSLRQLQKEMAGVLNGIDGLFCNDDGVTVDSFAPPAAMISLGVDSEIVFSAAKWQLTGHIWLIVERIDERSAELKLLDFIDPTSESSVTRVLMDRDWTYADYVKPTLIEPSTPIDHGGGQYLVRDITVEVVL